MEFVIIKKQKVKNGFRYYKKYWLPDYFDKDLSKVACLKEEENSKPSPPHGYNKWYYVGGVEAEKDINDPSLCYQPSHSGDDYINTWIREN